MKIKSTKGRGGPNRELDEYRLYFPLLPPFPQNYILALQTNARMVNFNIHYIIKQNCHKELII
jgi:hypothetical protein